MKTCAQHSRGARNVYPQVLLTAEPEKSGTVELRVKATAPAFQMSLVTSQVMLNMPRAGAKYASCLIAMPVPLLPRVEKHLPAGRGYQITYQGLSWNSGCSTTVAPAFLITAEFPSFLLFLSLGPGARGRHLPRSAARLILSHRLCAWRQGKPNSLRTLDFIARFQFSVTATLGANNLSFLLHERDNI